MDDLITFLRDCLDDDERVAREALHDDAVRPGEWTTEHHGMGRGPNTCHITEDRGGRYWSVAHDVFIPNAEHIARWDPARVLADIDAKRRIIDDIETMMHDLDETEGCEAWAGTPGAGGFMRTGRPCTCGVDVMTERWAGWLARPYADRPGYRAEWNADAGSARLSEPQAAQRPPAGGIGYAGPSEGLSGGCGKRRGPSTPAQEAL